MLTPEQRIEAYKWANDNLMYCSICLTLDVWIKENNPVYHKPCELHYIKNLFPEFAVYEPKQTIDDNWWPCDEDGDLTRLSVLSACIEEVEKQIKEK